MVTIHSKPEQEQKPHYNLMKEITHEYYLKFLKKHDHVVINNVKVPLNANRKIKKFAPSTFTPETTTVWSFPDRGNWSPYIPRNLILRYTQLGELDQIMGSGTTLVECKLLGRRAVGRFVL